MSLIVSRLSTFDISPRSNTTSSYQKNAKYQSAENTPLPQFIT